AAAGEALAAELPTEDPLARARAGPRTAVAGPERRADRIRGQRVLEDRAGVRGEAVRGRRPDERRRPVERQRGAEVVVADVGRRDELRALRPRARDALVDVRPADAGRVLARGRADEEQVALQRQGLPDAIAVGAVVRLQRLGVDPGTGRFRVDLDAAAVGLRAVGRGRVRSSDHEGRAAQRDRVTEVLDLRGAGSVDALRLAPRRAGALENVHGTAPVAAGPRQARLADDEAVALERDGLPK